jgi:116 kDa U5 small nuclear ribonucleoprotein component
MEKTLYDEFGNYIGPELDDEDEESEDSCLEHEKFEESLAIPGTSQESTSGYSIIPYEDKQYYPSTADVYEDVEVLVEDEDTQPLTEPIISQVKTKDFDVIEREVPVTTFDYDYLAALMYKPHFIRHVVFLGHFHSGKTSLIDVLVKQTHNDTKGTKWSLYKQPLYCDSRKDEIERGLSVKAVPMSLVLPASNDKSYLFHLFDTPGHVNFQDECTAAIRLCDGAVLVVDALSGVMCNTERLLRHALQERLSITVIINCIDRLIVELRLPPVDAYFKLCHTIEEINAVAEEHCTAIGLTKVRFSPLLGNVAFASGLYGFVFTLKSFAQLYIKNHRPAPPSKGRGGWLLGLSNTVDIDVFAKHLWGDVYQCQDGRFSKTPETPETQRTFVTFILNPIYKIFAHTVGEERVTLQPVLQSLNIFLKEEYYKLDSKTLLKEVCKGFFGDARSLVDFLLQNCLDPKQNALRKVSHTYSGSLNTSIAKHMINLEHNAPLVIHVVKSYHRPDCTDFDVLGRVMSGVVYKNQKVRVLGEAYTLEDPEDNEIREITHLWIYQASRYRVEISHVPAGNWVLLGGLSSCISKTATITNLYDINEEGKEISSSCDNELEIFSPLKFYTKSVIRVSCEPLNPSELPRMLEVNFFLLFPS